MEIVIYYLLGFLSAAALAAILAMTHKRERKTEEKSYRDFIEY